jgi:hypothetical protein
MEIMNFWIRGVIPFLVALILSPLSKGESVKVSDGAVNIDIPIPPGYVNLSPSEEAFGLIKAQFGSNGNELMAVLMPEELKNPNKEEFSLAMNLQFFIVLMAREVKNKDFTLEDFAKAKRDFDGRLDGIVGKKQTAGKIDAQPIHESSGRHFTFAGQYRGELGEACAVGTLALLRGRLWTLVVRNEKGSTYEDLVHAKSDAKEWVAGIITNNPSDEATLEKESRERFLGVHMNWSRILTYIVIGTIFGWFGKNKKKALRR